MIVMLLAWALVAAVLAVVLDRHLKAVRRRELQRRLHAEAVRRFGPGFIGLQIQTADQLTPALIEVGKAAQKTAIDLNKLRDALAGKGPL